MLPRQRPGHPVAQPRPQPQRQLRPVTQAQPGRQPTTPPRSAIARSARESLAARRATLREAAARHPSLRYLQIVPVALLLWSTDAFDRFRADAAPVGLRNAVDVNALSMQLGGGFAVKMNDWLYVHPSVGSAAAWYYIVLQGAITGIVGVLLIWRRVPSFGVQRNALIAGNLIGLIVFLAYPVAPPRMLPGYHDITARAAPIFASMLEGKAAAEFAATPSLHVVWAIWVAIAAGTMIRRPALRAAVWLYPVATTIDVMATANHYLLDAIAAPGVVLLAYAIAASPALVRRVRQKPIAAGPA